MIRFQAPQIPPVSDIGSYYARSTDARWYSNEGPCQRMLAERLAEYLGGAVTCMPVANCTLGLMIALRALVGRHEKRNEVLVPSFTFAATVDAIVWAGLTPVFVDVEPNSWHMSPDALRAALDARASTVAAALPCSTFGVAPPTLIRRAWEQWSSAAGVPLIVDSAAGFGSRDEDDLCLGRQGDIEVFSFHATKTFAVGEGGLVVSSDPVLAERVSVLANFGLHGGVVTGEPGLNAKLAEWPAATALAVLDRFDDTLALRRSSAASIRAVLEPRGFMFQPGAERGTWQFVPALAPSAQVRDAIRREARARGIEVRTYFDPPLHRMPAFRDCLRAGDLSGTDEIAARIVCLPMANDLAEADRDRIVDCVLAAIDVTAAA